MNLYLSTIRATIKAFPAVVPHLAGRARWVSWIEYAPSHSLRYLEDGVVSYYKSPYSQFSAETKTYDYYLRELSRMVQNVYEGSLGGEFIDIMASLIYGQLQQAYQQAWSDEGDESEFPQYLSDSFEDMYLNQFDFVDAYYRAIIDAKVDNTPIDPLLQRATMWAGQWDTAYRQAVELIRLESGGNLQWKKGDTEKGCSTCAALDGIIMSAREWQELDVHPRGYPNNKLECEGGGPGNNCDCTLEPTTQRRSAGAYGRVIDIVSK